MIDLHNSPYMQMALSEISDITKRNGKCKENIVGVVKCCKCGAKATLFKQKDGTYICKECKKEVGNGKCK